MTAGDVPHQMHLLSFQQFTINVPVQWKGVAGFTEDEEEEDEEQKEEEEEKQEEEKENGEEEDGGEEEQGRIHDCSCRGRVGRGSNDLGRGSRIWAGAVMI